MKRMDICQKCGQERIVRDHHIHGYGEEYKDEVAPYCLSCDLKAHNKARKEGRCILTSKESARATKNSYRRRSRKIITLSCETLLPNIQLYERLEIWTNTSEVSFNTCFRGNNGKHLKVIDEMI